MAGSKKIVKATTLSSDAVLAFYEKSLSFLPEAPEKCASSINKELCKYVWYDFYLHLLEPDIETSRIETHFNTWERQNGTSSKPTVTITENLTFNQKIKQQSDMIIAAVQAARPNKPKVYHTYKMVSNTTTPKVALLLFRSRDEKKDNSFSKTDIRMLEYFSPHLFLLYRTLNKCVLNTQEFQYFNSFGNICSKIARTFKLTPSEIRLLPDLITGDSNELIPALQRSVYLMSWANWY
jgi:hypothetical protein